MALELPPLNAVDLRNIPEFVGWVERVAKPSITAKLGFVAHSTQPTYLFYLKSTALPLTPALSQWEREIKVSLCDFHGKDLAHRDAR
ncbi:MAG: hypothetical protein DRR06_10470 [Gammaproteobacteria bacterium]|nr:MAG: hypothetical protein DRR06_10470 [Gammaproteobacteria bacterium]